MFNTEKIEKLRELFGSLDTRVEILDKHKIQCDLQHAEHIEHKIQCDLRHAEHIEHRMRLYDKLDEALVYLKNISTIMEDSKPTISRSKDNFTTIDTLRNWAIWLTAILGCIASAAALFHFHG